MVGLMDRVILDYYDNTDHNYIGYCKYDTICDVPSISQEKVIELPIIVTINKRLNPLNEFICL